MNDNEAASRMNNLRKSTSFRDLIIIKYIYPSIARWWYTEMTSINLENTFTVWTSASKCLQIYFRVSTCIPKRRENFIAHIATWAMNNLSMWRNPLYEYFGSMRFENSKEWKRNITLSIRFYHRVSVHCAGWHDNVFTSTWSAYICKYSTVLSRAVR